MITETILKPIGKGQYTPPQAWRKSLGIENKPVRAKLEGNRIVLEPLETELPEWDVKAIRLNELDDETINLIKENELKYQRKDMKDFHSLDYWENL